MNVPYIFFKKNIGMSKPLFDTLRTLKQKVYKMNLSLSYLVT